MTPEQAAAVAKVREALDAGPTDGPWFTPTGVLGYAVATIGKARICSDTPPKGDPAADLAYIAACDPATIRTILAALDAAQAERDAARSMLADALGDTIKCPRDHDWRPQELQAVSPRQECSTVKALRAELVAAQAPREVPRLTDGEIEADFKRAGGRWDGNQWVIEDADLHPCFRAVEHRVREVKP